MNIRRATSNRKTPESSEESITTLHSWMQKNEQMISSISGRLAVVETRLSLVSPISESDARETCGPIQHLVQETKRPANVKAWARVLDHDLAELQERLQTQSTNLAEINNQLADFNEIAAETKTMQTELKTGIAESKESVLDRLNQLEQQRGRHLTMRLGRFELPLELSGILIGGLAFTVAALIILGQKNILGDPLFLAGIGIIFLASTVLKHLIVKIRNPIAHPISESLPLPDASSLEDHA